MICKKCGKEISDDSKFCPICGCKVKNANDMLAKISKKKIIIITIVSLFVIGGIGGFFYFNNPISKFKHDINENNYVGANAIFNDKIKGNSDKESQVDSFLTNKINEIQTSYKNNKIDYNKAKTELQTIKNTSLESNEADSALDKIQKLYNSKNSFDKAEKYIKENDFVNAIKEYENVIYGDNENYNKAKEDIKKYKSKYKEQILNQAKDFATKQDYKNAVALLNNADSILKNDNDITVEKTEYQEKYEKQLQGNQQMAVFGTMIIPDSSNIDDEVSVTVQNKTNKVVKKYVIGVLMYDDKGYPLKSGILAGENELFKGKAEDVNIQSQQYCNNTWDLYTDYGAIKQTIACVQEVDYYDNSTWKNPYFDIWKNKYMGKPLSK